ncbi:MAG TPA: SpoIIE family protein phosphatase [Terriglobales bacterium]|nr:SpoIIE family protein phosphatase [Terriglobales bacterium]
MRFFEREDPKSNLRLPRPAVVPDRDDLSVSALYRGSRLGGDYFDFVPINGTRMLFLLSDVAGQRDEAMHVAAALQDVLAERARALLEDEDANVSDAVTALALELNRMVIHAAGGVRPAPTFLGCLDEQFGLLHYVNAGHTPALIRSVSEIIQLDSTGLPFGLFSHATHDAAVSVIAAGSSIVLVSKGVIEATSGKQEFGTQRVKEILEARRSFSAQQLCHEVLESAVRFSDQPSRFGPQFSIAGFRGNHEPNDMTIVCLMRVIPQAAAASA